MFYYEKKGSLYYFVEASYWKEHHFMNDTHDELLSHILKEYELREEMENVYSSPSGFCSYELEQNPLFEKNKEFSHFIQKR